jgi:hypothetical protein
MLGQSEIWAALIEAIQLNPRGYLYLSTDSFIAQLREKNWHFTLTDDSENSYWILHNMGRVS